ncbi:MAG TPA: RrF2 family transcriptional regulator [Bacillota bacterium]|nr:RrF2 family transcriptional regulator [Bacillota bacterium]
MMISTKGRYALRVMIDLAEHDTGEYIPLKEIAERQEISEKYLENIISVLTKANYLSGLRGKGGGYRLTRRPEQYTVGSILKLTEGSLAPVACLKSSPNRCTRSADRRTLPMWEKLYKLIDDFFESITIAELAKDSEKQLDYSI